MLLLLMVISFGHQLILSNYFFVVYNYSFILLIILVLHKWSLFPHYFIYFCTFIVSNYIKFLLVYLIYHLDIIIILFTVVVSNYFFIILHLLVLIIGSKEKKISITTWNLWNHIKISIHATDLANPSFLCRTNVLVALLIFEKNSRCFYINDGCAGRYCVKPWRYIKVTTV